MQASLSPTGDRHARDLGYEIGTGELVNKNWAQRIRKIQRRLLTATRVATCMEKRVLLLNSIVLPSILFIAIVFELIRWMEKELHSNYVGARDKNDKQLRYDNSGAACDTQTCWRHRVRGRFSGDRNTTYETCGCLVDSETTSILCCIAGVGCSGRYGARRSNSDSISGSTLGVASSHTFARTGAQARNGRTARPNYRPNTAS